MIRKYKNLVNLRRVGVNINNIFKIFFFLLVKPILTKVWDPLISYRIGDICLKIPLSHNLPVYRLLFENYSQNLGRIVSLIKIKYPNMSLVDIGANIGDTIAFLRLKSTFPILAIEGDKYYFRILENNTKEIDLVTLKNIFIGKSKTFVKGKMYLNSGTGRFLKEKIGKTAKFDCLDNVIKGTNNFLNSKVLKIDTDGYDFDILSGGKKYLIHSEPVVFLEFDPQSLGKLQKKYLPALRMLSSFGYNNILVYDNYGDYLLSTDLNNHKQISDLYDYASGRNGNYYYDICIFHKHDNDLFNLIREKEKQHYSQQRNPRTNSQ